MFLSILMSLSLLKYFSIIDRSDTDATLLVVIVMPFHVVMNWLQRRKTSPAYSST